jgi:hypothetical protein
MTDRGYFCSEIVADVYKRIGILSNAKLST